MSLAIPLFFLSAPRSARRTRRIQIYLILNFVLFVLLYLKAGAKFLTVYPSWLEVLRIILAPRRQERKVKIRFLLAPFAPLRESLRFL